MSNKLLIIGEKIKNVNIDKLRDFTYICPDDRQYIVPGNIIKYVKLSDPKQKIKTGLVVNLTCDKILLKALNSSLTWTIKMTEYHIFYKFVKDDLMDAIQNLLEKNENKI
jgi:hypothetical protein